MDQQKPAKWLQPAKHVANTSLQNDIVRHPDFAKKLAAKYPDRFQHIAPAGYELPPMPATVDQPEDAQK